MLLLLLLHCNLAGILARRTRDKWTKAAEAVSPSSAAFVRRNLGILVVAEGREIRHEGRRGNLMPRGASRRRVAR